MIGPISRCQSCCSSLADLFFWKEVGVRGWLFLYFFYNTMLPLLLIFFSVDRIGSSVLCCRQCNLICSYRNAFKMPYITLYLSVFSNQRSYQQNTVVIFSTGRGWSICYKNVKKLKFIIFFTQIIFFFAALSTNLQQQVT